MKMTINRLLPVVFAGLLLMNAGCAKHEVIKQDESLVPAASKPTATAPINQGATKAMASDKPIAETNVKLSAPIIGDRDKSQSNTGPAVTDDLQKVFVNVYFDFDSSTLSEAARQALAKDFALIKKNPQSGIRVEGHCDERGSDEYNLALGERRAQTAVSYLTTMGVPATRLSTISYGKEKPADPGHDETAWARNRRDEFIIAK
jgi:peptidoglycan-associated lipoprotein